jgi:hypothetical protein
MSPLVRLSQSGAAEEQHDRTSIERIQVSNRIYTRGVSYWTCSKGRYHDDDEHTEG